MSVDRLLKRMPETQASFDPCFAFSVHKSGSTLMHSMLDAACRAAKIPAVTVPDIMFNLGDVAGAWQSDSALLPLFQKHLLYFGFRSFPAILADEAAQIRNRRFVLLVRDPRDALVSQYFSFGRKKSSHAVPKENADAYLKTRDQIEETEIDEYVLREAPGLARKLGEYRHYLDFDHGMVRRYEDIYYDKLMFLADIFAHFGIDISEQIVTDVARQHDIRPAQEDDSKHIRKGTPGDHREKLAPATISSLNEVFRDVGAFYGYDL